MTLGSLLIDIGWFGFGFDAGPPRLLCLGPVRAAWSKTSFVEKLAEMERSLAGARIALSEMAERVKKAVQG